METNPIGLALPVDNGFDEEDVKVNDNIETDTRRSTKNYRAGETETLEVIEALRLKRLEYYRKTIDIS